MNFKKTALATAIGATLAISGVAQADGHTVSVYGRINNAINIADKSNIVKKGVDKDDEKETNVNGVSSRFGIKASAPINADLTAFGRYEFSTTSDSEGTGVGDTRIAEVGVKGGFGSVKIGNMWSGFYNTVGTHMDPTVTEGAIIYSTFGDLPYRVSNNIQYSNDFGPVTVYVDLSFAESEDGTVKDSNDEKIGETEGQGIAVNFAATDELTLAFAVHSQDGVRTPAVDFAAATATSLQVDAEAEIEPVDEDRMGFAAKYAMDSWWASLSYGEIDYDKAGTLSQTHVWGGYNFGDGLSAAIGVASTDIDPDKGSFKGDEPEATIINVTKKFGKSGFRVFWEFVDASDVRSSGDLLDETDSSFDLSQHKIGARIDF